MRNISKPLLIGGATVAVAIIAFLAFGVFGVHTLFIDKEVVEANPFEVAADASTDVDTETADDPADDDEAADESASDEAASDEAAADPAEAAPTPEIVTVSAGTFVDGDHPTSGAASTITDGSLTFLRFEGLETDNGPDLNVYLRSSENPDDYIDLGDLKGNIGDQNYELPSDVDLDRYDLVDIWCVRFGVSFGTALLSA